MWGDNQEHLRPKVRDVALLPGERVVKMLSERDGLVDDPQHRRPLLALTDRRLLLFTEQDGQAETVMASLEHIGGVEVKASGRNWRPLAQGLALMVIALLAYLLIGNFVVEGVLIPAIVGIVIGVIGVYMVLRYIFWEEEGSITLHGEGWTSSFPYQVRRQEETLAFLEALFALKSEMQGVSAREGVITAPSQERRPEPQPPVPSPARDEATPVSRQRETEPPPASPPPASRDVPEASRTTPHRTQEENGRRSSAGCSSPDEERRDSTNPGIGDDVQA